MVQELEFDNVAVFGLGYVGLTAALCLADVGFKVWGVDPDASKVQALHSGSIAQFEPKLQELLEKNYSKLQFSTDAQQAIENCQTVLACVGTPMNSDGSANVDQIHQVAEACLKTEQQRINFFIKSTVPPGTNAAILKKLNAIRSDLEINVISNPEFLRQGQSVDDFYNPARVVIGVNNQQGEDIGRYFFSRVANDGKQPDQQNSSSQIQVTSAISAELSKYAANAFLATRIAFINEIARVADKFNADIEDIRHVLGRDQRIGYNYLSPGLGYGGYCLPKDVSALNSIIDDDSCDLLHAVMTSNDNQIGRFIENIKTTWTQAIAQSNDTTPIKKLAECTVACWGLSFKAYTDDTRQSPAVALIQALQNNVAKVQVYDPEATLPDQHPLLADENFLRVNSIGKSLENADFLVIVTEWPEFSSFPFEIVYNKLSTPIVFDSKNIIDFDKANKCGLSVIGMGKRALLF